MNATTTYTTEGLVLHPDALRAVLLFAADEEYSKMMACVFIDEEGHLSATNGHAVIRLASIDPGGQVPRDRGGTRWPLEYAEATTKSCRLRGQARDHARVCLRWDAATLDPSHTPRTAATMQKHLSLKPDGRAWAVAARYLARLAEASEILLGKAGAAIKGPVLVHLGPADGGKLWEVPWHDDAPASSVTYLHGPTVRSEEPRCSAEVMIMPVRL